MAILEVELQPDEQAKLEQEAQIEGLSVKDWVRHRLTGVKPSYTEEAARAFQKTKPDASAKPLWEVIADLDAIEVPAEERERLPHDGSINYKHYLYGTPKVDVPKDLQ